MIVHGNTWVQQQLACLCAGINLYELCKNPTKANRKHAKYDRISLNGWSYGRSRNFPSSISEGYMIFICHNNNKTKYILKRVYCSYKRLENTTWRNVDVKIEAIAYREGAYDKESLIYTETVGTEISSQYSSFWLTAAPLTLIQCTGCW